MLFFSIWGFFLWLVVTILVRFAGEFLLNPDNFMVVLLTFVFTAPLIAAVTYPIYIWRKLPTSERPLAAIYTLLTGMFLDVFIVLFYPVILPNLSPIEIRIYSALLLWAYSWGLLSGFFPKQLTVTRKSPSALNIS
ncbi:DUF5367 domain-containing protein [Funiculus sociatus GB2-A5]|uniref:DUF5367 domain-containing protein n=1 Tax=Funiculus sociatus GB2-A5 TaxID=2933946 RepID=A0ABV0JRC6_9CYAN|nr:MULTISPECIES: DUF5367 family protein [unclassified Trichocoleus]MBD1906004.1 DUF5367 family protein [Trichocoleus sp. FACHB-832]MBD2061949.1 DUF5367 family protein [Trichocoleus sp. FACHB-6]